MDYGIIKDLLDNGEYDNAYHEIKLREPSLELSVLESFILEGLDQYEAARDIALSCLKNSDSYPLLCELFSDLKNFPISSSFRAMDLYSASK